jgi:hypothetical protein
MIQLKSVLSGPLAKGPFTEVLRGHPSKSRQRVVPTAAAAVHLVGASISGPIAPMKVAGLQEQRDQD